MAAPIASSAPGPRQISKLLAMVGARRLLDDLQEKTSVRHRFTSSTVPNGTKSKR